ncbi:MAG: PqiA/YebS family transporter subunit [Methylomarinum sp.]|nr:PqiA/YebS family transporter subunit [Methylomarinum sp.]
MTYNKYIACHECNLLIEMESLPEGNKAHCPRCKYMLTAKHYNAQNRIIAFSITALIFLFLSLIFPFLTFSAQGQDRTVTLVQSISVLMTENFSSLAILIFVSTIAIPGLYLLSALYVNVSLKCMRLLRGTATILKLMGHIQHWSMAEIFLIGILVSFIKITALADVSLGLSFSAYVLFIISMSATIMHMDKHQVWRLLKEKQKRPTSFVPTNGNYQGCHECTDIAAVAKKYCDTCGSHLHPGSNNSLQKTWALLVTSIMLYIPANMLPIMHTNFLGDETANTIMGGIIVLWHHGSYPIALIIFIASILVPIGKILALCWLCYSVQTGSEKSYIQKTQLYRITEMVGRWSMVDVFVVAILVALIQLGKIMSIYPGWGAVAFAGMVIVTVLAAISFDPRLIWNPLNKEVFND